MKFIFAIAALAIAAVSAQVNIISVTSPLTGTVYTAGKPAVIAWINAKTDTISKIVLARGPPAALVPISTIAENVDAKAGSYIWNVPADFPAGDDYAFEFGTSPDLSFTGLFTIKNDGTATAPSSFSSSAASRTSSASSVSSSSAKASTSTSRAQVTNASDAANSQASASQAATPGNSSSAGSKLSYNKVAMGAVALAGAAAAALV